MKFSPKPYFDLVGNNKNYRRLWLAQIISNFGDWFGLLAIYALIQSYTDSELLLGLIIVIKTLSLALFSPFAGYITDRMNRRKLMIWCDIFRGFVVLGFILIVSYELLWLAYLLMAVQMIFSAIFEPAKTSSIPNVTTPQELVIANILSAASWSIIFTSGMAVGGFATAWLGTDAVFVINFFTYLLSAVFIYRAVIPQEVMSDKEKKRTRNPLTGIKEGFQFLIDHPEVMRPTMAKGMFTSCIGALVYLLILVAEDILLMGSVGLGILYAARGVGTGIGPVIGRRIFNKESTWIKAMGFCMVFGGLMYTLVSISEALYLITILVMLAHAASGSNWVMSTVLLQRRAPDTFRGRVFSTEWLLFTLAQSVSVTIAALLLEFNLLTIRETIFLFSIMLSMVGVFWLMKIVPAEEASQSDTDPEPVQAAYQQKKF
ncbi:MFS transporter [Rhodohalobacter sp. SW132]|uniref:MFS transporter n=1 Tax=Rhodohalobacter sp. SW132 TaxID=2293433 RepID=UPI000E24D328|nr:MFS transporter [Rhodohalobacter sp. SW132]REL37668.1 MFS transporter [Rhodohalobacter sp. SW132]